MRMEIEERFWSKVDWYGREGCWEWQGAKDQKGYGHFRIGDTIAKAHRVAYELEVGDIPEGLQIDHLCRNKSCVRPEHLEPVTNQENTLRSPATKSRTHCAAGHEYTVDNLRHNPATRGRYCAQCNRDRSKAHYQRKMSVHA